jgi:hypothetical protein
MAGLSSTTTYLRLIMTTRAKLAEVSAALSSAAAAGHGHTPRASSSGSSSGSSAAAAACPAALTALPLQPWAWPWSAQCGCKGSSKGADGSSSGGVSAGQQMLRAQHPPLQAVLHEMGNTAASIHRRVMIFLRVQETVMQG